MKITLSTVCADRKIVANVISHVFRTSSQEICNHYLSTQFIRPTRVARVKLFPCAILQYFSTRDRGSPLTSSFLLPMEVLHSVRVQMMKLHTKRRGISRKDGLAESCQEGSANWKWIAKRFSPVVPSDTALFGNNDQSIVSFTRQSELETRASDILSY